MCRSSFKGPLFWECLDLLPLHNVMLIACFFTVKKFPHDTQWVPGWYPTEYHEEEKFCAVRCPPTTLQKKI